MSSYAGDTDTYVYLVQKQNSHRKFSDYVNPIKKKSNVFYKKNRTI